MDALLLTADRVILGPADQPPIERGAVLIDGGRIVRVGPADAFSNEDRMDLPGHTLMPGLIDAHVHLALPGDGASFPDFVKEPIGVQMAVAVHNAEAALRAGITTLKDCGGPHTLTFELRRAGNLGYAQIPRLHLCGRPLTIRGGHCWYFGGECGGRDGVAEMVREVCKQGADYVKAMGSGGGTPHTMSWLPAFTPAELARMADEAHRLGRRLAVHCLCAEATLQALAAGVDVIEHCGFITGADTPQRFDPRVAEAVAQAGVVVCPTLSVGDTVLPYLRAHAGDSPADRAACDRWERMFEENMANTAHLRAAGVPLISGTDAGWRFTPFDAGAREMELLKECGLSTAAALASGTSGAAGALGIERETGTLAAGLSADIIAVPGNPLSDMKALKHPALVMRAGEVIVGGNENHGK